MGEAQSRFDRNQAEEDVITYDPRHQKRMEDLFLVIENQDDLEHNLPYPMALRPFPASFWKYSIGDNRSNSRSNLSRPLGNHINDWLQINQPKQIDTSLSQIPTIIHPPGKKFVSDPSIFQHGRSKSFQHQQIISFHSEQLENCREKNMLHKTQNAHLPVKRAHSDPTNSRHGRSKSFQHQPYLSRVSEGKEYIEFEKQSWLEPNSAPTPDVRQSNPFVFSPNSTISTAQDNKPHLSNMQEVNGNIKPCLSTMPAIKGDFSRQNTPTVPPNWTNNQIHNTPTQQPITYSQQPFDSPFLSQLWRESEIHCKSTYRGIPVSSSPATQSTNSNICSSIPSQSLPKVENHSALFYDDNQQKINDLELQCSALQQQIQHLRSTQPGLTESQKNIEIILNEVQDDLGLSDVDYKDTSDANHYQHVQNLEGHILPKQNNTFLSIPNEVKPIPSPRSSMDSGLGFPDLSAILGTSPFGSTNDICETSTTNSYDRSIVKQGGNNYNDINKPTESTSQFDLQM